MNIIDIQDNLKDFSEQQLIKEIQMPSGIAPQFLVLSEINRRKRMRDDYAKSQAANQMTVAEEAIAAGGVPQTGIRGMSEAMAPQSSMAQSGIGTVMNQAMKPSPMPQREMSEAEVMGMAEGGVLRYQKGGNLPLGPVVMHNLVLRRRGFVLWPASLEPMVTSTASIQLKTLLADTPPGQTTQSHSITM